MSDVLNQESEQDAPEQEQATEQQAPAGARVEEEGDLAADYLEELLDIADLDGDIDIESRNGRSYISIVTEDDASALDRLVGKNGQVLDALQELTRLNVLTSTGHRSRLVLDISGYRQDRSVDLQQLAADAVAQVKESGAPMHLKPLGSYERKIVHDAVADLGFSSESEGEGAGRHIVVSSAE